MFNSWPLCVFLFALVWSLEASASHYDEDLSARLARMASSGYCSGAPDKLTSWSCPMCGDTGVHLENVHFFASAGVGGFGDMSRASFGYAGKVHDGDAFDVYVSFRGTFNVAGWITDFKTNLIDYPGAKDAHIHAGFYVDFLELSGDLHKALSELNAPMARRILVTGYSLGGALAVIAAYEMHLSGLPVTDLYTYGSPRVGDAAYADAVTARFSGSGNRQTALNFNRDIVASGAASRFLADALYKALQAAKEKEEEEIAKKNGQDRSKASSAEQAKILEISALMEEAQAKPDVKAFAGKLEIQLAAMKATTDTVSLDTASITHDGPSSSPAKASFLEVASFESSTSSSSSKRSSPLSQQSFSSSSSLSASIFENLVPPMPLNRHRAGAGAATASSLRFRGGAASDGKGSQQHALVASSAAAAATPADIGDNGAVNSFRIVWRLDLAPHAFTGAYRHTGTEVWYDNKHDTSRYRVCDDAESDGTQCSLKHGRRSCEDPTPALKDWFECASWGLQNGLSPLGDHLGYNIKGRSRLMIDLCIF